MSEPTKEAIEEARNVARNYGIDWVFSPHDVDFIEFSSRGFAVMLADVRKQARDDALEGARLKLESMRAIKKNVVIETPEEKARRKGVPLIPKRAPVKPMRSDSTIAICGECGLEIKMVMGYCCSKSNCPAVLGSPYCLAEGIK